MHFDISTEFIAYTILLLALTILPLYLKLKNWKSWLTVILSIFWIFALALRLLILPEAGSNIFISSTNLYSAGAYSIFTIVAVVIVIGLRAHGRALKEIKLKWWIVGGYLLFGLVQQILFKFIFFDTLYYVLGNGFFMREAITILISAGYYSLFHSSGKDIKNFVLLTFCIDIGWGTLYMALGNLHWNILSHAIIGGAFFSLVYEDNKDNLNEKFASMESVMEDVVEAKAKENVQKLKDTVEENLPPKVKELRDKVEVEITPRIQELRDKVNKKVAPRVKEFKRTIDETVHRKHV